MSSKHVITIGLIFHCIFLLSIFDIYFRTHVHPVQEYFSPPCFDEKEKSEEECERGVAERVVIFSLDGARADRLFEYKIGSGNSGNAESFRKEGKRAGSSPRAPFVHEVIETRGRWGVSHTRVPTESRPGHVAMLAGLYEDPAAVTEGWQHNPVPFDSVINASHSTWAWGSPDILSLFLDVPHAKMHMYSSQDEDFATDGSQLDQWVFVRVHQLFEDAKTDEELAQELRKPKTIFFLHLLGIDTNGHAYRPHSHEYLSNMEYVDSHLRNISQKIELFFNDNKTAFVVTSDHGMSAKGSHGDGHPSNTRTPLVAFGAGVAGPCFVVDGKGDFPLCEREERERERERGWGGGVCPWKRKKGGGGERRGGEGEGERGERERKGEEEEEEEESPKEWHLGHLGRNDVDQADVAVLIASLLGVRFPKNSVGVLPTSYLDFSPSLKLLTLISNARQISAQFYEKEQQKKDQMGKLFRPFPLLNSTKSILSLLESNVHFLEEKEKEKEKEREKEKGKREEEGEMFGSYEEIECECYRIIHLALEGIRYYQTYDWGLLMFIVTIGYLGWIFFSLSFFITSTKSLSLSFSPSPSSSSSSSSSFSPFSLSDMMSGWFLFLFSFNCLCFFWLSFPLTYYLYSFFALFFWVYLVIFRAKPFFLYLFSSSSSSPSSRTPSSFSSFSSILLTILSLIALEVVVFSYYQREALSLSLLFTTLSYSPSLFFHSHLRKDVIFFFFISLSLSLFLFLPTDSGDQPLLIFIGGLIGLSLFLLSAFLHPSRLLSISPPSLALSFSLSSLFPLFLLFCGCVGISTLSSYCFLNHISLSPFSHLFCWFLLFVTPFVYVSVIRSSPSSSSSSSLLPLSFPLLSSFFAIGSIYALLTISYELIFFSFFFLCLLSWMRVESKNHLLISYRSSSSPLPLSTRVSLFFQPIAELRRCVTYLVYCHIAFFGTGNFASLTSFDLSSTYRFVTVFSPFLMGALLILKVLLPFLMLALSFILIHTASGVEAGPSLIAVGGLADILTINFFFFVRDHGSWFEIGQSISHFAMADVLLVFQLSIFGLATFLLGRFISSFLEKEVKGA